MISSLRSISIVACLLGLIGLARHLHAAPYESTISGTGCKVTLRTPFENVPTEGALPFEVEIQNDRDQAGTWHLEILPSNSRESFVSAAYDFTVEPHASNTFSISLPLALKSSYGWISISPTISGPGINDIFQPVTLSRGGGSSPLLSVFSSSLYGKVDWSTETTSRQTSSKPAFFDTDVAPAAITSDWKGLTGVGTLLLTDSDWLGLRAEQRQAVLDYVAMGGRLGIYVTGQTAAKPESLGLPIKVSGALPSYPNYAYRLGMGFIGLEDKMEFSDTTLEYLLLTAVHPSFSDTAHGYADSTWAIGDAVGKVLVNSPLIVMIVLLFSTLVGPINLIYFAPANKRIRLFWTTPLISLGASALLLFGILIVDGLGGKGRQAVVIYSLPQMHQEMVLQEQASRTAVLLSTAWKNVDDALVFQIPQYVQANYYGGSPDVGGNDQYRIVGQDMSGNWFKSRSVAWQYLRGIRPTRSCLTITNLKEVTAGKESPKIISSYAVALNETHVSIGNKYWVAHAVQPGQPTECTAESEENRKAFFDDCRGHVGPWLKDAILEPETGADPSGYTDLSPGPFFIATADPDDRQVIHTLTSVRWQVDEQVYLGSVVDQQEQQATHDH